MSATHQRPEAIQRGARMLRTALGAAIARFLDDDAIVEVMLNPDGRIWVDRLAQGLADTGEHLSPADGERIIRLVAHHVGAEVHARSPRVSAELPETGERFEGLLPPVVTGPAFAIRKPAVAVFSLDDYVVAGIMTADQAAVLRQAVAARANILVAGGTSTGKTTLTGQEAVDLGFATSLLADQKAAAVARYDLSIYRRAPASLQGVEASTVVSTRVDLERLLHERAGLSRASAKKVVAGGFAALAGGDEDQDTALNELAAMVAQTNDTLRKMRK